MQRATASVSDVAEALDRLHDLPRRDARRAGPISKLLVAALLALVVGGCSGTHSRLETLRHEGPLHLDVGGGGLSLFRPLGHRGDWWATVGSILPCSAKQIRIVSVQPLWTVRPRDFRVYARWWHPIKTRYPEQDPIGSAEGTPPAFAEPYAHLGLIAGTVTTDLAARPVTSPCPVHYLGQAPTELLISMHVDQHGGAFDKMIVTYRVGAQVHRRLVTGWTYVACGDRIKIPKECPAGEHAPGVASEPG